MKKYLLSKAELICEFLSAWLEPMEAPTGKLYGSHKYLKLILNKGWFAKVIVSAKFIRDEVNPFISFNWSFFIV